MAKVGSTDDYMEVVSTIVHFKVKVVVDFNRSLDLHSSGNERASTRMCF